MHTTSYLGLIKMSSDQEQGAETNRQTNQPIEPTDGWFGSRGIGWLVGLGG